MPIESISPSRRHGAGLVQAALGAPVGPPDAPRSVGPFAVVVHALPIEVAPGTLDPDFDVRPHPHIGLAAVTYMLEGHVTHRDSLGSRREVGPGGINWTIAGRGIVHSERFDRLRLLGGRMELMQLLIALPDGGEDIEPSFVQVAPEHVPTTTAGDATIRRIIGEDAPPGLPSPMFFDDVSLDPGGRYQTPTEAGERALYVMAGTVGVDGTAVEPHHTVILAPGPTTITCAGPARIMAFGGAPVGPRYMWWNYIHSSLERIDAAKAAWRAGTVPLPPGDTEAFTPAPPDHGRPLQHLNRVNGSSRR